LARFQKVTFSNITDSLQTDHSSLIMHPFLGKQMKMTSRSNVQECIFTRTYVTFGSLLSQMRLSSVYNVRAPYSRVEAFSNISSPLCTFRAKFYGDRPWPWPIRNRISRSSAFYVNKSR